MSADIDSRSARYRRNTSEKYSFLFFVDGRRISELIGGRREGRRAARKKGGREEVELSN